jgi:hypothetical protein
MSTNKCMRYSIYCYTCPITNEIFYVGQDSHYGKRGLAITQHFHGAVQHKLRRLLEKHLQPIITRLCQFENSVDPSEELNRAEIYWMAEGRRLGWPLMNVVEGGRVTSGWSCTEETRMKISLANRGKKRSLEQRVRIAEAHRGLKASIETRTKMSKTRKNRPKSQEHIEAILASRSQWTDEFAAEVGKKIAASKRGKPRDDATRTKISAKLKGKPWSEARRAAQQAKTLLENEVLI